jgi:hypothetical protein
MLSELSPQTVSVTERLLAAVAFLAVTEVFVRFFMLLVVRRRMVAVRMFTMTGTVMLLVQLLGFLPIVAFAGNEGNGGNRKEHRENFHRAPCIAAA